MSVYPDFVVPTQAEFCVRTGARWGHREIRATVPGTDLCGPCHGRFPRILGDLVRYWRPLHDAVARRPNRDYKQDRVDTSGVKDASASWNPAATTVIVDLEEWTRYVTRTILGECPAPSSRIVNQDKDGTTWADYAHKISEDLPVDQQLATIAQWYSRWLTHYPTLGPSWLDDVITLRQKAMQAVDPGAPTFKRILIRGQVCANEVEETEWGPIICGAPLVGLLRTGDGLKPSEIVCSVNPGGHARLERKDWILAQPH